jgi:uncharacterized protein YndB with AHSA1/START domain
MDKSKFIYAIYIRTTPAKLWQALTEPEFTRQYWFETWQDCEWKPGATWRLMVPGGKVADSGKVLEIDPPRRLVLTWRHELDPALTAEGYSRMTYEIEQQGDSVKLTVHHEIDKPHARFIDSVSDGWPRVLTSLKSLLETGKPIEETRHWPEDAGHGE